jgi:5-oxoprolinase (ATP-hydrolysing)
MSAGSVELFEEGAMIISKFLVRNGKFDEEPITTIMLHDTEQYPRYSGMRKPADYINYFKAQVSAKAKEAALVTDLTIERGLSTVYLNMQAITANAETCIRAFLIRTYAATGGKPLYAFDHMGDGTSIQLTIIIKPTDGSVPFDFTGTTTKDITSSTLLRPLPAALIYTSFICLVNQITP